MFIIQIHNIMTDFLFNEFIINKLLLLWMLHWFYKW